MRKYKFNFEGIEVGEFADSGPWRSYELQTYGNTLEELLNNGWIFEIDQDGGSLRDYKLDDASGSVWVDANNFLSIQIEKAHKDALEAKKEQQFEEYKDSKAFSEEE